MTRQDRRAGAARTRIGLCSASPGEVLVVVSIEKQPPSAVLTEAEQEVLRLVVAGLSNRAIAALRQTSPRTVANQIRSIFKRLGVAARSDLVAKLHG